jgi:hypothetical protein
MKSHRIDPGPYPLQNHGVIAVNKTCFESHSYASKMTVYGLNSISARRGAYIPQSARNE